MARQRTRRWRLISRNISFRRELTVSICKPKLRANIATIPKPPKPRRKPSSKVKSWWLIGSPRSSSRRKPGKPPSKRQPTPPTKPKQPPKRQPELPLPQPKLKRGQKLLPKNYPPPKELQKRNSRT